MKDFLGIFPILWLILAASLKTGLTLSKNTERVGFGFRSQTYVPMGRLPVGTDLRTAIRRCGVILFAPSTPPAHSPARPCAGVFSQGSRPGIITGVLRFKSQNFTGMEFLLRKNSQAQIP